MAAEYAPLPLPRSAPGLPTFSTAAAAAAHYRQALGITGETPPGSAWTLAAHLIERTQGRLELGDSPLSGGLILTLDGASSTWRTLVYVPAPGVRSEEERERSLLHELGHLLLTYGCRATGKLATIDPALPEYAHWERVHDQSERLAEGFAAAWRG